MKASEVRLLDFLRKSSQFVIPIYQRTYSWTSDECRQLWDDIIRTGSDDQIKTHFVGSIVYIEQGISQVSSRAPLLVIDGQQRLTTISLILEALARRIQSISSDHEPIDGFSAKKLRHYYLLNPLEEGERGYKLLLTQTDKHALLALMEGKSPPEEKSIRISENFAFFVQQIARLDTELAPLCKGLAKLMIVDIALSRDQDKPQLIFESMNSTGRALSQADLIRNFVLMRLNPDEQTRLYNYHWRPMEVAFGQEAYGKHFDRFMRHYLTVHTDTGEIPRISEVYDAFKEHVRKSGGDKPEIDALVKDVHSFAGYYCKMALRTEKDRMLSSAFSDLLDLKADVAYPLLLELYNDYSQQRLSREDFAQAVRLIESYVFRRAVCEMPTNSMNKTFATFKRAIDKTRYLESLQAHFLLLPTYRRFPSDKEFRNGLKTRDLYNFRSRSYWLCRLENHGRKERVQVEEYTIEHIMPQNENLPIKWRTELGEHWEDVHKNLLHTLGNLTLTGYNSEYRDLPFARKRDMKGGFRQSPLQINKGLGQLERWDEAAIRARADQLAKIATSVWPAPSLPVEILDSYRPKKTDKDAGYSLEDHKFLTEGGTTRELFELLRREVLALDPDVITEEIMKYYIAYKAETNFVNAIPQATRLTLTINMDFHELHDPRGIAKDVTDRRYIGPGNVQIVEWSAEDLPYVIGLVRQALEKQLGDEEVEA